MIVQACQAVADGLVAQQLVGLHEIPVGIGQFLDQPFGFRLLSFDRGDVRNRFDHMRLAARGLDLGPLHEEIFVVREGDFAGRGLAGLHGLGHLAEGAGRRTRRDFLVTRAVGNVAEFVVRRLVLKHDLMGIGIDDRDDHRLRVQQALWIVLWAFRGERHGYRTRMRSDMGPVFQRGRFGSRI